MDYNEIKISDDYLNENVLCVWQMGGFVDNNSGIKFRHIPKGQNLLIFNFGDNIEQNDNKEIFFLSSTILIVPAINSSRIFTKKGEINLFGISFIADGLFNFIQQPVSKLGSNFPYELKNECAELFTELKKLRFAEQAKLTEAFLRTHINQKKKNPPFNKAFKLIHEAKGCVKISDLSKLVHVSERQLQRQFKVRLGISPKDYCKVVRVNSYIEFILSKERDIDWMELVVEFDYYDQPHLINEVKSITQLSPENLLKYRDTLYNLYSY